MRTVAEIFAWFVTLNVAGYVWSLSDGPVHVIGQLGIAAWIYTAISIQYTEYGERTMSRKSRQHELDMTITTEELLRLSEIADRMSQIESGDPEIAHVTADALLLEALENGNIAARRIATEYRALMKRCAWWVTA